MTRRIEGIVVPVVTPLDARGCLDAEALRRHHEYLLANGVAGLFVLGTTGEGPALPRRVREEMIVRTVENAAGRSPVLVGISADGIEDSLETAAFAAQAGAAGVVAAPPCYLPLEAEELLEFYRILTKEQPLPLYIYNMPAMTKIEMAPELILKIASLPGVAGYKDSAGNFANFARVAAELKKREDLSLFMGPDTLLGDAMKAGACGGVNSGANLAPQYYVGMYRAARAGDMAEMARLQRRIEALQTIYGFRENICCGVAAGLKYALARLGIMEKTLGRPARVMEPHREIDDFVDVFRAEYSLGPFA